MLKGDGADAVAKLKKEHGKALVIFGSGVLIHSLMRRKLIDEFVLQIHPLVLGKGRRLFSDGSSFTKLESRRLGDHANRRHHRDVRP